MTSKKIFKNFSVKTKVAAFIFTVTAVSFALSYFVLAWSEPFGSFPTGNVPLPVNVSSNAQIKAGDLSVVNLYAGTLYDAGDSNYFIDPDANVSALLAGNVGIGTTSPGAKLDVNGTATAKDLVVRYKEKIENYDADLNDYISTTELLTAANDYNNGKTSDKVINIMAKIWSDDLQISGLPGNLGVAYYNVFSGDNTLYSALFTGAKGVKIEGDLNVTGNSYLATSSGNVGIGTATPGEKLEVAGQVKITGGSPGVGKVLTSDASGLAFWQSITGTLPSGILGQTLRHDGANWAANNIIYNDGTNVGIGTTSPGAKLEVVGDIVSKGTSWTSRTSAADNDWHSVTYGNGLFVAVAWTGAGNRVMTSPDGITWTSRASAADNSWLSVTYGNGLFVAVANFGIGNRVMTSPDGITWTIRTSAADNDWTSVTYGNGLFVAVAFSGAGNRVMTSPDGITWTIRASAADNQWRSVTYGNGLFVAVARTGAGDRVMTSPDGIIWTIRTSPNNWWTSVTYGNGLFVAVAWDGIGNRVMTSPDGITWTSRASAADNQWLSVTYGNGLFVAVAASGIGNRVMTSPDGITWTSRASAADNWWPSVTYGNGLFVAVARTGAGNRVMTSGKIDYIPFSANNLYQGGMNIYGNVGIGTTVPQSALHIPDGKYAQFEDNNAGAPPAADCDNNNERGRMSIDTTNNRLYICNGAARGWDWIDLED